MRLTSRSPRGWRRVRKVGQSPIVHGGARLPGMFEKVDESMYIE